MITRWAPGAVIVWWLTAGGCLASGPRERLPAGRVVVFEGACDASGAVSVDGTRFVVADDEDNTLRVYDALAGGAPLESSDVSGAIALSPEAKKAKKKQKRKKKAKSPKVREADLEGATRLGDHAIWVSSHGQTKGGKRVEDRHRYFVTEIPQHQQPLRVVGVVYRHLLDDLLSAEQLAPYGLVEAARRAARTPGSLDIEGLTAAPEGFVWLGFRSPVPRGKALMVPLLNPVGLSTATPARWGPPVELDLGGRGIRALSWWGGRYLIVAGAPGPSADGPPTALYTWTASAGVARAPLELGELNVEAVFSPDDRAEILLLADDGDRELDGVRCKDLEDPADKQFRGVWVTLTAR